MKDIFDIDKDTQNYKNNSKYFVFDATGMKAKHPENVSDNYRLAAEYAFTDNIIWREFLNVKQFQERYPVFISLNNDYDETCKARFTTTAYLDAITYMWDDKDFKSYIVFPDLISGVVKIYNSKGQKAEQGSKVYSLIHKLYQEPYKCSKSASGGSNSKAKWIATGQKVTIDGKPRALYTCASRPGEVRIRKMRKDRDGKVKATYVKHEPVQKKKRG